MTPSTANVHGGTSRPSRAAYGSTQPPMQASTWQRTPARRGAGGERGDRVDHAVRVGRCGPDDEHGPLVDGGEHPVRVGPVVGTGRHHHRLDPEVVGGLVERRVHGVGDHDRRPLDVRAGVARGLHGEQARLRPPGGDRPDRGVRGVEQVAGEADEVVLHRQQAREGGRVEAVGAGVRRHGLAPDPVDLGQPGVVDVGQRPAAVDRQVAGLQGAQPGQDVVGHASTSVASSE